MFDFRILRNLGRSHTSHARRGYVALTSKWRNVKWFIDEGHIVAHLWDRVKWHYGPKLFIVPDYPCHIEVEASAACQMRCPMCAQGKIFEQGVKLGLMSMETFRGIVDEIHNKVYSIKLSWRGEPALNPHLHDMVRYAKLEKKMKSVAFLTNFERYDEKMIDDLLTTGVDYISISADGLKETYDKIRYPAVFEETVAKVAYLRRRRDELGMKRPLIRVQSLYSAIKDDPEAYLAVWEPVADRVHFIADQWRASLDENDYDLDPDYVCSMPFNRMAISWNGRVTQCISDYGETSNFGDVNRQSVHEIWHNEHFAKLRQAMRTNTRFQHFKACRTCTDGARTTSGELITVKGRKLPVRINAGRKYEVDKLDGSTNKWKKDRRRKETSTQSPTDGA